MGHQINSDERTMRTVKDAIEFALSKTMPQNVLIVCANEDEKKRIGELLASTLAGQAAFGIERVKTYREPDFKVVLEREKCYRGWFLMATFNFETVEWYRSSKRRGHVYDSIYFDHHCYEMDRATHGENEVQRDEFENYWRAFLPTAPTKDASRQAVVDKLGEIAELLRRINAALEKIL